MFDRLLILIQVDTLFTMAIPLNPLSTSNHEYSRPTGTSECPVCGNVNPEQIFNIVESNVLDEYGNPTRFSKDKPFEWNEYFKRFAPENPTLTHNQSHSSNSL